MKRLIYLTLVLMIACIIIGCSAMTAEQRNEESGLTSSVGNRPFVGETSGQSRDETIALVHAYGR